MLGLLERRPTTTVANLQEYSSNAGNRLSVEEGKGVVRDVKILGSRSANGREYPRETMVKASGLYEGRPVYIDHSGTPGKTRSYRDQFGVLRGVHEANGELRGDLHFNPKHQIAAQFEWDAANNPSAVGLSHDVMAKTKQRGGVTIVEDIVRVNSVDLVTEPATTKGLHESVEDNPMEAVTLEHVTGNAALMAQLKERFDRENAASEATAKVKEELDALKAKVADQEKKLGEYKIAEEKAARLAKADELLEEHGVDQAIVSDLFREQLAAAPNDEAVKKLIEDRVAYAKPGAAKPAESNATKPRSKSQNATEGNRPGDRLPKNVDEFVEMVTAR